MTTKVKRQIKRRDYTVRPIQLLFLNMEAESEERGLSNQRLMHLRPKRMLIWMRKVNLKINLIVMEILNVFK